MNDYLIKDMNVISWGWARSLIAFDKILGLNFRLMNLPKQPPCPGMTVHHHHHNPWSLIRVSPFYFNQRCGSHEGPFACLEDPKGRREVAVDLLRYRFLWAFQNGFYCLVRNRLEHLFFRYK
jgi:hypothetical protein